MCFISLKLKSYLLFLTNDASTLIYTPKNLQANFPSGTPSSTIVRVLSPGAALTSCTLHNLKKIHRFHLKNFSLTCAKLESMVFFLYIFTTKSQLFLLYLLNEEVKALRTVLFARTSLL